MEPTFVERHTRVLAAQLTSSNISIKATTPSGQDLQTRLTYRTRLRALLAALEPPLTFERVKDGLDTLAGLERDEPAYIAQLGPDCEEVILKKYIVDRIVLGMYRESLQVFMGEAVYLEGEANWWADVERSWWNVSHYLLQSKMPVILFHPDF